MIEQLLNKLSGDELLDRLKATLKVAGEGRSRIVFFLDDRRVLKVAINEWGFEQNESESRCTKEGVTPKIYAKSKTYEWLISERVKIANQSDIDDKLNDLLGIDNLDELKSIIWAGSHEAWAAKDTVMHSSLSDLHDRMIKRSPWYKSLFDLIYECDTDLDEIRYDNVGLNSKGDIVVLDTGA